ncbi:MAG: hypothetical protein HF978_04305 [Desulfobacteraceae bacterium]|nr:hypothetical protein [Desulfobacteraceae bacterium]MBC2754750.1 hypothetical protein [Desulfobacteraceae bacterium]
MNKRNKIILIALFFFFTFALIMGIYLFPDEEPMLVHRGDTAPEKITPQQPHNNGLDAVLKTESPLTVSPVNNAALAPRADDGTPKVNPYVSYPETLFELLGIDMNELVEERDTFKNTIIHVEWMDRVNEILKDLDPEKKEAIIKNQTSLLYMKDKLNKAYLTGKIDHETYIKALADLMKWHQKTYESILTGAEYEALFEISPEKVDESIDALLEASPEYSFILNQEIPVEEVKEQVQGYKLEEVNSHFKKMILDRDDIGKQINAGEMTLEQARATLNKSQQAFIARCKEILTEDEINTIFGSVEGLESGSTKTEAPKVLGDTDEIELGFKIENPETSIDNVTEKIDKDKIDDIKFFYQQRDMERDELIEKLDAGEITAEELENISSEMDAAFEENCRNTLTNEEYQLVFGNHDN